MYPNASAAPDTKICSFICIPETLYNDGNGKNANNILKTRLFFANKCLVFYAREKDYTSGAWVTELMEQYAEIEISSNDLFRKYLSSSICLATYSNKHTILETSNWDIRQKGDKYSFKLHIPLNMNSRYAPRLASSTDCGTFEDSINELTDDDRCKLRTLFDYVDESNEAVTLPAISYMLMCQCNSILHVMDMKPGQLMNIVLPSKSTMRTLLLSLGNSVNIQFSEDKPECSHFTKFDFNNDYVKTIFEDRCDSVIIGDTFLGNSKTDSLYRQFSNSLKPIATVTDFKELINDK